MFISWQTFLISLSKRSTKKDLQSYNNTNINFLIFIFYFSHIYQTYNFPIEINISNHELLYYSVTRKCYEKDKQLLNSSYDLKTCGQFLIHVTIETTICRIYLSTFYTALLKRNHSVTMVLPMVERLRNWPVSDQHDK